MTVTAFDAMVDVRVGIRPVENAVRSVVDAQAQPGLFAALAEGYASAIDGVVGHLPIYEQAVRIDGHAGHSVIVVGPGNGDRRLGFGLLTHFELV